MLASKTVRQTASFFVAVLMIGAISFIGAHMLQPSDAATAGATITLNPSTASVDAGGNLSVAVVANSPTDTVNAVQAALTYDASQLQYVSMSEGGAFPVIAATSTDQPGIIRVGRGSQDTAVSGSHTVVTVTFKVLAGSGTANIGLDQQYSSVVRSSDNTDILESVAGGSYTVKAVQEPTSSQTIFSMTPASGTYAVGTTIPVSLKVNSPSSVTTVQTVVGYPADKLEYVSTTEGGKFTTAQRTKATAGTVDIIRGVSGGNSGLTGSNLIVTVNFKIIAAGTANLTFIGASSAYDNSGTGTNILNLQASTGASYTFPTIGGATPPAPPVAQPPAPVTPPPATNAGATTTRSGSAVIAVASGRTTNSQGNTQVQGQVSITPVADPAILQQNPGDSIVKVVYYLDGEVAATVTTAPFTYQFDTKQLRNGTYEMRVDTQYASGTVDSNTDKLVVKNPVNMSYVMKHYLPNILMFAVVGALLAFVAGRYLVPTFRRSDPTGNLAPVTDQNGTAQRSAELGGSLAPVPPAGQPTGPVQQAPVQPERKSFMSGGPVAMDPTIITPDKPSDTDRQ